MSTENDHEHAEEQQQQQQQLDSFDAALFEDEIETPRDETYPGHKTVGHVRKIDAIRNTYDSAVAKHRHARTVNGLYNSCCDFMATMGKHVPVVNSREFGLLVRVLDEVVSDNIDYYTKGWIYGEEPKQLRYDEFYMDEVVEQQPEQEKELEGEEDEFFDVIEQEADDDSLTTSVLKKHKLSPSSSTSSTPTTSEDYFSLDDEEEEAFDDDDDDNHSTIITTKILSPPENTESEIDSDAEEDLILVEVMHCVKREKRFCHQQDEEEEEEEIFPEENRAKEEAKKAFILNERITDFLQTLTLNLEEVENRKKFR